MTNRPVLEATSMVLFATSLLAGCNSLSGVGGTSEYSCKAQPGVRCESVSGIYQNALHNNLPGQRSAPTGARPAAPEAESKHRGDARAQLMALAQPIASSPAPGGPYLAGPQPLRSSARILRLWFKPWEDADHDLFDQGYIYIQVDGGRWMLDHVQRRAREDFALVRPPRATPGPAPSGEPSGAVVPVPNRPQAPSADLGPADSLDRLSARRDRGSSTPPDSDE